MLKRCSTGGHWLLCHFEDGAASDVLRTVEVHFTAEVPTAADSILRLFVLDSWTKKDPISFLMLSSSVVPYKSWRGLQHQPLRFTLFGSLGLPRLPLALAACGALGSPESQTVLRGHALGVLRYRIATRAMSGA